MDGIAMYPWKWQFWYVINWYHRSIASLHRWILFKHGLTSIVQLIYNLLGFYLFLWGLPVNLLSTLRIKVIMQVLLVNIAVVPIAAAKMPFTSVWSKTWKSNFLTQEILLIITLSFSSYGQPSGCHPRASSSTPTFWPPVITGRCWSCRHYRKWYLKITT